MKEERTKKKQFLASYLKYYLWAVNHSFVTGVDYNSKWKEKSKKEP